MAWSSIAKTNEWYSGWNDMTSMFFRKQSSVLIVCLIVGVYSFFAIRSYTLTELGGDFDKHYLPGAMFPVPEALEEKGYGHLLFNPGDKGWDGQFYYYISNDLLGVTDVPEICDAHAYRYQRIGLPLIAAILSEVTFQDYVTPSIFYLASFLLVLTATYFFAAYLKEEGYSPYLALFWSLSFGTQVTLLNGLPDATADSLLMLSLLFLLKGKRWPFAIAMAFCVLSREVYILFPTTLVCYRFVLFVKSRSFNVFKFIWQNLYAFVPMLVFAGWLMYLRLHFGIFPSAQSGSVLGSPLEALFKYFMVSFRHSNHPLDRTISTIEAFSLLFFVALLVYVLVDLLKRVRTIRNQGEERDVLVPVSFSFSILVLLYFCFGDTVMMHRTGYLKAVTIFLFTYVFLKVAHKEPFASSHYRFLILGLVFSVFILYQRVHPLRVSYLPPHVFVEVPANQLPSEAPRLANYQYEVEMLREGEVLEETDLNDFFRRLLRLPRFKDLRVRLKNLTDEDWRVSRGLGTVNMSYHWLDESGRVVMDGLRTRLTKDLEANQEIEMDMWVGVPQGHEKLTLVLSPVQEGYAWFYTKEENGPQRSSFEVALDLD